MPVQNQESEPRIIDLESIPCTRAKERGDRVQQAFQLPDRVAKLKAMQRGTSFNVGLWYHFLARTESFNVGIHIHAASRRRSS